jgi:predicted site-specific integrase-resolvase
MPPIVLNAREISERVGASYEDVLSWTRRGIIPSIPAGGRYYYNLTQVLKALNRRATATPEREVASC